MSKLISLVVFVVVIVAMVALSFAGSIAFLQDKWNWAITCAVMVTALAWFLLWVKPKF